MDKQDIKNLKRRYLIWLYKTTKEAFDRYERKFTQLDIDKLLLDDMERELKDTFLPHEKTQLEKYVNDFRSYIIEKENSCAQLKFQGKKVNPEFLFLDVKLDAIEKTIARELGRKALAEIKEMFEQEFTERIMEGKDH